MYLHGITWHYMHYMPLHVGQDANDGHGHGDSDHDYGDLGPSDQPDSEAWTVTRISDSDHHGPAWQVEIVVPVTVH